MSIKLMSAAWELDIPSTEKMVLMCLCDFANDDGDHCWPSISTIARKCSKGERTVQVAIRSLETLGFLTTYMRNGTSNSFRLHPRKICTPAKSAPPQKTTETPADSAPKPPRTTINNKKRAIPANWWPEEFGEETKSRAIVDGWDSDELAAQVEQFKANHTAKGNTFIDPQAAWSTWVLNSRKFGGNRNGKWNGNRNNGGSTWAIGQELLGSLDAAGNH